MRFLWLLTMLLSLSVGGWGCSDDDTDSRQDLVDVASDTAEDSPSDQSPDAPSDVVPDQPTDTVADADTTTDTVEEIADVIADESDVSDVPFCTEGNMFCATEDLCSTMEMGKDCILECKNGELIEVELCDNRCIPGPTCE